MSQSAVYAVGAPCAVSAACAVFAACAEAPHGIDAGNAALGNVYSQCVVGGGCDRRHVVLQPPPAPKPPCPWCWPPFPPFPAMVLRTPFASAQPQVVAVALQGESARRAITGAEFFNRFPSLHTFLLTQLQAATRQLQHGGGVVHPSLFPVLALLSRLR